MGETGVGKSVVMEKYLEGASSTDEFVAYTMKYSAQTKPTNLKVTSGWIIVGEDITICLKLTKVVTGKVLSRTSMAEGTDLEYHVPKVTSKFGTCQYLRIKIRSCSEKRLRQDVDELHTLLLPVQRQAFQRRQKCDTTC